MADELYQFPTIVIMIAGIIGAEGRHACKSNAIANDVV